MRHKHNPDYHKQQGDTLKAILNHGRLMDMTGATPKDTARAMERKCREARHNGID